MSYHNPEEQAYYEAFLANKDAEKFYSAAESMAKQLDKVYQELEEKDEALMRANKRLRLTAFGVGMLAFLAGFGVCWLVFVR
jgi:hypothetical protein